MMPLRGCLHGCLQRTRHVHMSVVAYVVVLGWPHVCSTYCKTQSKHCMAPVSRKGKFVWRKLRARPCTHAYVHIRTCIRINTCIRTCIRMLLKSRIAYLAWASWQHDCYVQLSFGCDQSGQNFAFFLRQNRASSAQALRKATCLWQQGGTSASNHSCIKSYTII